ncbi:hypothetical protein [Paludisphaera mucosa]|uniref:Uncharacterized protein n=1 Tax=Paludisphaera mucosa TaxID=3030827 RepID=A0ABT6FIK3_9BACT|nr:hypothetical protein [Paludisphaera mucosa]MDG3007401.1 hypothetical protein [Paludisphaera mucosa]
MASDDRDIERRLSQAEAPRLVAGVHRVSLRDELMRRMEASPRRRAGPVAAWRWWVMNFCPFGPVPTRLAWALGAVILLGAAAWGGAQVAKKVEKLFVIDAGKASSRITRTVENPDGTTTWSSMVSAEFFASDDPNMTGEKVKAAHEEVDRLVDEGKATEIRREPDPLGTRVYLQGKRADGAVFNTSRLLPDAPEARERRMTMFLDAVAAGKTEFVRRIVGGDGTTIYEYRVKLADGTAVPHFENLPIHDKALTQRHRDEIEQARVAHAGLLLQDFEMPDNQRMKIYQVRLSDGDVAVYASPEPPLAKPSPGK